MSKRGQISHHSRVWNVEEKIIENGQQTFALLLAVLWVCTDDELADLEDYTEELPDQRVFADKLAV